MLVQRMTPAKPSRKEPSGGVREPLTAREREILELLGEGLSNKEIGGALRVSQFTIKNHLARIFAKLQVRSRTAAVMTYLKRTWKPR